MTNLLCHVTWNNHSTTFLSFLRSLQLKESFCDATVVCQGKFYPVHQLVLSSCSEYFEEVFTQAKCKHPFIIIKGVSPSEFEALLNYMYKGEVNVPEGKLTELVKAAEELQIKGLSAPDQTDEPIIPIIKSTKRHSPSASTSQPSKRKKETWLCDSMPTESLQEEDFNPTIENESIPTANEGGAMEQLQIDTTGSNVHHSGSESPSRSSCRSRTPVISERLRLSTPTSPRRLEDAQGKDKTPRKGDSKSSTSGENVSSISPVNKTSPAKQRNTDVDQLTGNKPGVKEPNPMVQLNVDEYIRAVEEIKHKKTQKSTTPTKTATSTRSGSSKIKVATVVHVSDAEKSPELRGQRSRKRGKPRRRDVDLITDLHLGAGRRSLGLLNESDGESIAHSSRSANDHKGVAKYKSKTWQTYNLNHIGLNSIFTYRVFRNLNLFIECLLKDRKKEDAFARSLINIFKSYMNYRLVSDVIAATFEGRAWENQGVWIQKLALLEPPVFGTHVQLDSKTSDILFSNEVIPALMVLWQFRVLINKHGLVKDLIPGFTSTPRHKFLLGIKKSSKSFRKEQLTVLKHHLRNFYRYSLN